MWFTESIPRAIDHDFFHIFVHTPSPYIVFRLCGVNILYAASFTLFVYNVFLIVFVVTGS